jgi:hypothetical protein
MDSITNKPVLVYDDKCSSCTLFAMYAFRFSKGKIDCMGHYSEDGERLRKLIFPPNFNETKMFWIITSKYAYGGRSGLLPLIGLIIRGFITSLLKRDLYPTRTFTGSCSDSTMCDGKEYKMKRFFNLLRYGKKLDVKYARSVKG